jgi:hypothetical protein
MTMRQAVRIRCRVARLRRMNTWDAQRLADIIEGRLLSKMGWSR